MLHASLAANTLFFFLRKVFRLTTITFVVIFIGPLPGVGYRSIVVSPGRFFAIDRALNIV